MNANELENRWFSFLGPLPNDMRSLTLAYVGDAVYELFMRHAMARTVQKPQRLHQAVSDRVSARGQAVMARKIFSRLNEEERAVFSRGKNAKNHRAPAGATVIEYRLSTALESVIGFLYVQQRMDRLVQLMQWMLQDDAEEVFQDGATTVNDCGETSRHGSVASRNTHS